MARIRFVWRVLVTGARWLNGVLSWVGSGFLVLGLVGVSVSAVLGWLPVWAAVAVAALILMAVIVEGSYQITRDATRNRSIRDVIEASTKGLAADLRWRRRQEAKLRMQAEFRKAENPPLPNEVRVVAQPTPPEDTPLRGSIPPERTE